MRRGLYSIVAIGALALLALTGCENLVRDFAGTLNGAQVVPPVTTTATGEATAKVDISDTQVEYDVDVNNLANITRALLFYAPSGENGDSVAVLYPGPTKTGPFTGQLCTGTLLTADLKGPMAGKDIKALISALRAGSTYVSIRTDSFPNGEIRGQLR
jgi:hypothetical protein